MPATVSYCVPSTTWNYHTPKDGSAIGGNQPTGWKLQKLPDGSVYLEVFGSDYDDVEFYASIPILPEVFTGNLVHEFDIMPDANSVSVAQAIEFDTILTYKGMTYTNQGSTQLNVNEGGNLQITNNQGQWVDIGDNPGCFQPGVKTHVKILYQFDLNKHTGGAVGIAINDGKIFPIPDTFRNEPAKQMGWADSLFAQFQLDTNKVGGTFGEVISNGIYTFY